MGVTEETILRRVRREGGPLPNRIQNAPQLELGLDFMYASFFRLSTCRALGMGVGPISWLAVAEYADRLDMDEDELSDLEYLIGKMDETYLKYNADKLEEIQRNADTARNG